jgi:hypothetical protein
MNYKLPLTIGLFLLIGQGVSRAEDKSHSNEKNISAVQQVTQAKNFIGKMNSSRFAIQKQLESSRSSRDIVKTLCLNDKLNQIDVAVRSAQERKIELQTAADRGEAELISHNFTILSVLSQRVEQFYSEGLRCISQDGGFIGEVSIKTSVDPAIPAATTAIIDNNIIVQPPTCSSCFK